MNCWVLGADFRTAPLEVRSALMLNEEDFFSLSKGIEEKVLLSTCNRIEWVGSGKADLKELIERWASAKKLEKAQDYFKIYEGRAAASHIFRTTASLESMVVGESQILGQVKRAYDLSVQKNWIGPDLHKIFQRAFRLAKRIRYQTEVGRFPVSIPSIGVKLAEQVMGDLRRRKIAILGLGEIGRVAAEHFASLAPKKLILFNRTRSVAEGLAQKLKSDAFEIAVADDLSTVLNEANILVSAVDAKILGASEFEILRNRGENVFVLDLSVPPSVDRNERHSSIYLFSVDDLERTAKENLQLRQQELEKAERMVEDEVDAYFQAQMPADMAQTVRNLESKVQHIVAGELRELKARLPQLNERDWLEIEKTAQRLASRVIQDPIIKLKDSNQENETIVEFFRSLFRI